MLFIRTGKKGISTIIANVMMIAIVLSIATVLVFWAQSSFGTYSSGSQMHFNQQGKAAQERFVIENVYFNATYTCDNTNCNGPNSRGQIAVFVRNAGQEEVQVVGLYINATLFQQFNSTTTNCQPSGNPAVVLIPAGGICKFTLTWPTTWTDGTVFHVVVASARGNQARYQGSALGPPFYVTESTNKTYVTYSSTTTNATTTYTTHTGNSTTISCSAVTTSTTVTGSSQKASTFVTTFLTTTKISRSTSSSIYSYTTTSIHTVTSTFYTTTKSSSTYSITTTTTITNPVSSTSTYTTTFMVTSTVTSDPIFSVLFQFLPQVTKTTTTWGTQTSTASTTTTSTFSSPTEVTTTFTTTNPSTLTVTTTSTGQTFITSSSAKRTTSILTSSSPTMTTTQTSSTTLTKQTTSITTLALTPTITTTFLTSKQTSVTSTVTYTTTTAGTTSLCTTIITKLVQPGQLTSGATVSWPSVDWFAIMPLVLLGLIFASKTFRGEQEHVGLRRMNRRRNSGS